MTHMGAARLASPAIAFRGRSASKPAHGGNAGHSVSMLFPMEGFEETFVVEPVNESSRSTHKVVADLLQPRDQQEQAVSIAGTEPLGSCC